MRLSAFDYPLPQELIAQYPLPSREKCRLLVLDRAAGSYADRCFEDVPGYFGPEDLLVLNDTRVIPARLVGKRISGGRVEIFLIETQEPVCEALVRPSARLREGEKIALDSGDAVTVLARGPVGRFVKFERPVAEILRAAGHIPLPPYITRPDDAADRETYQTVYGMKEGATASPTAGLHFTKGLIERVKRQGARVQFVTLHTNYGTFAPIKTEDVEAHRMHKEYFELPADTIDAVRKTKARGGRVFAVGTTSTRVLESCRGAIAGSGGGKPAVAMSGYTDMFIYPGYRFGVVDALITNFHMPRSTLMVLVSAFAGLDRIKEAYRHAIDRRYRFFSYGDAMLIV